MPASREPRRGSSSHDRNRSHRNTTSNSLGATPAQSGAGITARRTARRASGTSTSTRSSSSRLSPVFKEKLRQLAQPLAPLVQMTSGAVHPRFPRTLLGFWLLTDAELDDLARFYHQRDPGPWKMQYPCPVTWEGVLTTGQKRRKFGKFIGLRGCETPITLVAPPLPLTQRLGTTPTTTAAMKDTTPTSPSHPWLTSEEQIMESARRARLAEDNDKSLQKKLHWSR
ncbi:hypothetical protein ACRALDRAFT_1081720 [Sodiomyces alcalophilus JCM 7366]|uniref:uncharacterized protein n=1 Tax=Sodiomyces alcalophilus JCM 7366 TaxID=591952 RepID=UPI0039B5E1A7